MNKNQSGFTLLELMISILLGLVIVAAGTTIFLSAQRSLGVQIGVGEVQQNANFGLSLLAYDLRHANLNMPTDQKVNNKSVGSGIIFNLANLPSSLATTDINLLTQQGKDVDATQSKSDQITIQFIPQYRVTENTPVDASGTKQATTVSSNARMHNCEGDEILFTSDNKNDLNVTPQAVKATIVQRYFVKQIPQTGAEKAAKAMARYGLYCDSGYYNTGDNQITGLGKNERLIMRDIDAFRIQLAVQSPNKSLGYFSINEYLAVMPNTVTLAADFNNVISIEVGLLAKANTAANSNKVNSKSQFNLAGHTVVLDEKKTSTAFLRQEISQMVGLRNTLGSS